MDEAQKMQSLKQAETEEEDAKKFLERVQSKMGAAQSEMVQQTLIQLKAQSALISLVRKTQHLRHEELKIAHEHAGHKVTKFEALLQEKENHLQRENGKDCDDI